MMNRRIESILSLNRVIRVIKNKVQYTVVIQQEKTFIVFVYYCFIPLIARKSDYVSGFF
jgi:hypothetical protein